MYRKNKIDHVICVGDQKDDKEVCKKAGASWVEYKNKPLGEKWNVGFLKAKDYNPDAVLYVGSSDWVSDNWIEVTAPFLDKFDIVGKTDFNMLHYGKERKVVHWTGYQTGSWREHEPIGIGRMLSAKFMEKVNWQPVASELKASRQYLAHYRLRLFAIAILGSLYAPRDRSKALQTDLNPGG